MASHQDENDFKSADREGRESWIRLFSPETPRGMLLTLALVTLIISAAGGVYLSHVDPIPDVSNMTFSSPPDRPILSLKFTQLAKPRPTAMAAGADNDFYAAYPDQLVYYRMVDRTDGNVEAEEIWSRPLDEAPTALYFVVNAASPFLNKIILAYPNRLEIIDPDAENHHGVPFSSFDDSSRLTGIAADDRFIYVADAGLGEIAQLDFSGKRVKTIGQPDEKTGFEGFRKGGDGFFDLDIFPQSETLFAARPDRFRIEAFSVATGSWLKERSWENGPENEFGFSGKENPAGLIALADGSFLTAEGGESPGVKNFDSNGTFLAEIDLPEITKPLHDREAPLLGITLSSEKWSRLLILMPDGKLGSLTVPP